MKKSENVHQITCIAKAPVASLLSLLHLYTEKKQLAAGRVCYDHLVRNKLERLSFWGDRLIRLLASCGNLQEANQVFHNVLKPSIYTWNAIISAHVQLGDVWNALQLHYNMQFNDVCPDKITFLWMLKACSNLLDPTQARIMHVHINEHGLGEDQFVGNTLVDMFAKVGSLGDAHKVFNGLLIRDKVSWGAIIAGYTQHGHGYHALNLYEDMQHEGIGHDRVILLCVSNAVASIGAITKGQILHDNAIKDGLELDIMLSSALIDMYAKCDCMMDAKSIFDSLPKRNVVSWGALVGGFSSQGYDAMVCSLYEQMQQEGVQADRVIFLCVLKSCGSLGALWQGRVIDDLLKKRNINIDVMLGSALVEMYVLCGSLKDAYKVLINIDSPNNVSWGILIAGYALYGNDKMVMKCLDIMRQQGLTPDHMVFTQVLASCSHAGLLEVGYHCFNSILANHNMIPSVEHYSCMVDLFGRAGCLDAAENLVMTMPFSPDNIVWRSLLTGCKIYSNVHLGRQCFDQIKRLGSFDTAAHILMLDIYVAAHMWEEADVLQGIILPASTSKDVESAQIEVSNKVHDFATVSEFDWQNNEFCEGCKILIRISKQGGYFPQSEAL